MFKKQRTRWSRLVATFKLYEGEARGLYCGFALSFGKGVLCQFSSKGLGKFFRFFSFKHDVEIFFMCVVQGFRTVTLCLDRYSSSTVIFKLSLWRISRLFLIGLAQVPQVYQCI